MCAANTAGQQLGIIPYQDVSLLQPGLDIFFPALPILYSDRMCMAVFVPLTDGSKIVCCWVIGQWGLQKLFESPFVCVDRHCVSKPLQQGTNLDQTLLR